MKIKNAFPLLCMLGSIGWFLWSCDRLPTHSEIPEIHYKTLVIEDRMYPDLGLIRYAFLTFSFIDGDGDLGVRRQDENLPDDKKSRISYTWFQKNPDGTYKEYLFITDKDTATMISSNIPYDQVMDKSEAQNKTLKGTIEIAMDTPSIIPQGVDTMRVEFFIVDRAMNKSNVEYTPDFSILNPPTELKAK